MKRNGTCSIGSRIAVDLGATSGRIVLESSDGRLSEVSRFRTPMLRLEKGIFWDFPALFASIVDGLSKLEEADGPFVSLSCDSWAQDFGLLDAAGNLLELPYSYRDTQSDIFSSCRLALIRETRPDLYGKAAHLLHIADLVQHGLCGAVRSNYTLVAVSGLGPDNPLLGELADCEVVGCVNHSALPRLDGVPVISGAGHDTAAAYMSAHPAPREAFISLGTWYMAAAPCPEDAVLSDGFTMLHLPRRKRARTIGGMGMWTFSRCLELWRARGDFPGYEALSAAAEASEVSGEIDLQAPSLFSPDNMEEAIWDELHCRTTPAQTTRLIFEGLARDLAAALRKFREPFNRVILGGGPSVNLYLRKLIQSRLEWPLAAGEQEATVAGNLLVQHEVLP